MSLNYLFQLFCFNFIFHVCTALHATSLNLLLQDWRDKQRDVDQMGDYIFHKTRAE